MELCQKFHKVSTEILICPMNCNCFYQLKFYNFSITLVIKIASLTDFSIQKLNTFISHSDFKPKRLCKTRFYRPFKSNTKPRNLKI